MEQLVWAVIILIFIIFTALKNRARNRPETTNVAADDTEYKKGNERDKISRYMEELLGIEIPETRPQKKKRKEKLISVKKTVKPEPKTEKKVSRFESPLTKKFREKSTFPEKKNIYCPEFSLKTLSRKDLPKAIILSEIIGPPISKRKNHRLF